MHELELEGADFDDGLGVALERFEDAEASSAGLGVGGVVGEYGVAVGEG